MLCISSLMTYRMQRERSPEMVASSLIFPATVATVAVWTAQWLPDKSATQFASFSLIAAQVHLNSNVMLCNLRVVLAFWREGY